MQQFFGSMDEYWEHIAASITREDDVEYAALARARDGVEAFELFVRRNVDKSLQAKFADGTNIEADLVREAIRRGRMNRTFDDGRP